MLPQYRMSQTERDEGKFVPETNEEEVIEIVKSLSLASTPNIKHELGYTRDGALKRLRKLEEKGELESSKTNEQGESYTLVWSVKE